MELIILIYLKMILFSFKLIKAYKSIKNKTN